MKGFGAAFRSACAFAGAHGACYMLEKANLPGGDSVPVVLTAVAALVFYAACVPVKIAFCARAGEGVQAGVAARPFTQAGAVRAARARLDAGSAPRKKRKPQKKSRPQKKPPLKLALCIGRKLLARTKFETLSAHGTLGLSDAATTALAVGFIQAALCAVCAALGARADMRLRPDFQTPGVHGEFFGIVSLRIGNIIFAVCAGALKYLLDARGRKKRHREESAWKNTRSKAL